MSWLRRARTPALGVTVLLVASFVIVGGIATGQSTNTYTGCLKGNGELSKVAIGTSPTQACSPSETQVSWNEQGPPGPQGDQGVTGAQGDTGPAGADGSVWFKGPNNPTNDLGADGDFFMNLTTGQVFHKVSGNWVTGPNVTGPEGPEGPPGPEGPEGPPGPGVPIDALLQNRPPVASVPITSPTYVTVSTLPLDPGNYVLFSTYRVRMQGTAGDVRGSCRITDPLTLGTVAGDEFDVRVDGLNEFFIDSRTMFGVWGTASARPVILECRAEGTAEVDEVTWVALPVDSLTETTELGS